MNDLVDPWDLYKAIWLPKTTKKIQKEVKSWRSYMQKHNAAYSLHGSDMTPPHGLADGSKLTILREILRQRGEQDE